MKETPIIMSGNHLKLILDGIKTQTRRVIKPQSFEGSYGLEWEVLRQFYLTEAVCLSRNQFLNCMVDECPYGQVGDRLGVKETHYRFGRWIKNGLTKTGKQAWKFHPTTDECLFCDDVPRKIYPKHISREEMTDRKLSDWYKRPSIFLPKKYIRIILEITEIRVERLQEITDDDIKAEGMATGYTGADAILEATSTLLLYFQMLWNKLNAKRGYGWNTNPWVWVISFRRLGNE